MENGTHAMIDKILAETSIRTKSSYKPEQQWSKLAEQSLKKAKFLLEMASATTKQKRVIPTSDEVEEQSTW